MEEKRNVALVTGVSSGIGRRVADDLVLARYRVFGTARQPDKLHVDGYELIALDVTDGRSAENCVREVIRKTGRLDVLVNNAGALLVGAAEEISLAEGQQLFETNFFGAIRMARAVLPYMRQARSGRIVFVGSVAGFVPMPFHSYYAASKHALEGFVESLDHEVREFGVRAIVVEPSYIRTSLAAKWQQAGEAIPDYAPGRAQAMESVRRDIERGDDPASVAKVILRAIEAEKVKVRYQAGRGSSAVRFARKWLPAGLFDGQVRKRFGLK